MSANKIISSGLVKQPISPDEVADKIFSLRNKKVMLDSDLARLYGVPTHVLNQAVKRNIDRFPLDFMFRLDEKEAEFLISQIVISKIDRRGGRRTLPYVFTEQGVAMLSSVLNSKRAILVNIEIMRAFAKIREMILSYRELQQKINEMEQKYDENFAEVFDVLRKLLTPPEKPKHPMGFHP
ncbi:MAG: ORF6N domain-containing protein [Candidatus Omnitrophica bacterium]|nr:ORF6N domain-containing protein [Candidatus Omnitrophota bacterium]